MALTKAPLAWLFAAAWAGCWAGNLPLARAYGQSLSWVSVAIALAGVAATAAPRFARRRMIILLAVVAVACAASVAARLAQYEALESHVIRGDRGVLTGRLIEVVPSSAKGLSIRLRPDHSPAASDVELLASASEVERALAIDAIGPGGRIEWPVRIYPYPSPGNPWEYDRRMWAAQRGLIARAYFADPVADPFGASADPPKCLSIDALFDHMNGISRLAWRWRCALHRALPLGSASVAQAMVLGQKDLIDPEVREAFSRSGIAHLLAVSGVHVGFVAMAALALVRPLVRTSRAPILRAFGIGLGVAAIGAYVLLVGGPASALRAGVMSSAAFTARTLGKRSNSFQTLGAAGFALLLIEPLYGFDLGFQLSFGATAGILGAVRAFRGAGDRLPKVLRAVVWSGILSLAASIFTIPPSIGTFSTIPWLSPLVNIAAIPVGAASILVIACGLVLGEVNQALGSLVVKLGGLGIHALILLAKAVPMWGAVESPAPTRLFTVGWYALAAGILQTTAATRQAASARSLAWGRWLAVSGALLLACSSVGGLVSNLKGEIKIFVIDVGQGDSMLVKAPWGRSILVDAGPARVDGYDAGAHRVVPTLKRLGVRTLDAVISTHPDADHVGGLAEVLLRRNVRSVFASWAESDTAVYRRFVDAAHAKGLEVSRFSTGDFFRIGPGAQIVVLASGALSELGRGRPSTNDRSIALSVEVGKSRFLLLGDMEDLGVARLMREFDLAADGLVIPHHGSPGPFWKDFLERINPEVAAISVGPNNFGHPSPALLDILERRGVQTARTDLCGAVTITLTNSGVSMSPHRTRDCPISTN